MSNTDKDSDTVVVCAFRGHFADDVTATCADCGATIQHRPHVHAAARKVCIPCACTMMREAQARGESLESRITRETVRDLVTFFGRKGSA